MEKLLTMEIVRILIIRFYLTQIIKLMKRNITILLSGLFLILSFQAKATIKVVTQQSNTFSPKVFNVTVGDTIRWVWTSGAHTTTSSNIPAAATSWDSPLTAAVDQFDYVVKVAGTYDYVCTPHVDLGMIGSFTATGTLGISNEIVDNSIKIYPNPAVSLTNVMFNASKANTAVLSVYDLLGNEVNKFNVAIRPGTNNLPLSVENILPGLYFIELRLKDQSSAIVRRFVKSR